MDRERELSRSAELLVLAGLLDSRTGLPVWDRGELLGALLQLLFISCRQIPRLAQRADRVVGKLG